MVKVLLITAVDISKKVETFYPPLGLAYIASYCKKYLEHKIDFKIIDRNIANTISTFKPDIIGISTVSQNYTKAIEIAKLVKKQNIPVIIGGIHISMLKNSFSEHFDIAVIGEGEQTFCEILKQFIENDNIFYKIEFDKIKGVLFREHNKLFYTGDRELIENIDEIPFPDRGLLNINNYDTHMFSSRGCPYDCSFCASTRFWKRTRFHSAKYVADEIEHIYNIYGCKSITFSDDLFIAKIDRLKEIIIHLRQKKILGVIKFLVNCRANLVNDELLKVLKELNVISIGMGLESGSPEVLKYLKGDNVTVEMNKNAINLIKKYGIKCNASFILGCPIETKETIKETYRFIKKSKLDSFGVYILTPFVGTDMWTYAKQKGLVYDNMDFNVLDVATNDLENDKSIIMCENLTKKELQKQMNKFNRMSKRRFIKNVIKTTILNPKRVFKLLLRRLNI